MRKWPQPQPITNPRRPLSVAGVLALFLLGVLASGVAIWTVGSVIVWASHLFVR
jgi:hypothetical protein